MQIFRKTLLTMAMLLLIVYGGLIVYAYWPYDEGRPAAELAAPEDRFVMVGDINIRYRSWGDPDNPRPTIVLIHGFANTLQTFYPLAPLLEQEYHVIALDMPGFGLSAKPVDHDYSNPSQGQVVADFVRQLGLEKVIIGGHSMGGAHALHAALAAPQAVGTIMFNAGIITTGVPPATQYFIFPLPRLAAKTFAERDFRESFLLSSYVNPDIVTDEVIDNIMLGTQTDDYIEGTTALMGYYKAGDDVALLADLKVPTLIVWGMEDLRKPAGEEIELRDSLAISRLAPVEDAGHYVHEEKPAAAAQAIIDAADFWATR